MFPVTNFLLDLIAAGLNYLDYFNQFEVYGKALGLLQLIQLLILSSRWNKGVDMKNIILL